MPTFRRVPRVQFERYQELLDYAFRPEAGPQEYEGGPPSRLGERWGYFDDQTLLTTCTHYDFDVRLRGEWKKMGGLAAVASPPEHRKQGYVREMIHESLDEFRDRGMPWVSLWPFDHDFYERLGWATANKFTTYECAPETLEPAAAEPAGHFEPVEAEHWERLVPAQLEHGKGTTLSMRRSREWWQDRVFERWGTEPYVYAWADEDDEIRGFVVYENNGDEDKTLRTYEISHADVEAYRQLLRFLANHESQVSKVKLYRFEDSDLLDMVSDPEAVDCTVNSGPMVRLVDVRTALSQLSYPEDADGRVIFDVSDELADWNDIRCVLSVSDGHADCTKTVTPRDALVDVGTLSQLVVGYCTVEKAQRLGGLECDEETAETLAELFPPERVCLREYF